MQVQKTEKKKSFVFVRSRPTQRPVTVAAVAVSPYTCRVALPRISYLFLIYLPSLASRLRRSRSRTLAIFDMNSLTFIRILSVLVTYEADVTRKRVEPRARHRGGSTGAKVHHRILCVLQVIKFMCYTYIRAGWEFRTCRELLFRPVRKIE